MKKQPQKASFLFNFKIILGLSMSVLFVLGLILVAQGFIDTKDYRDNIIEAIQTQTHRKVSIKGTVSISLLPVPTLYIPGLELRDPESDKPAPAAAVNMIRIRVPFLSAFSDHPRISAITLESPVLELVRAEDNLIHWDWLNTSLIKALADNDNKDPGNALSLEVLDGKVFYHDNRTDQNLTIDNVYFYASNSNKLSASGSYTVYGHDLSFALNSVASADHVAGQSTPIEFKMNSGEKNSLKLNGEMNLSGDLPQFKGPLELNLEDTPTWVQAKTPDELKLLEQVTNQFTKQAKDQIQLPLKLSCNWNQTGLTVNMDNVRLEGMDSAGTGSMTVTWKDWIPVINGKLNFSAINYDQWKKLIKTGLAINETNVENKYLNPGEEPDNPLPKNIELSLDVMADQLYYGSQSWKNAKLSASLADESLTVNHFSVDLPGDSILTLFGVITRSSTYDLRFEGSMETSGKSLRDMLTVFDESASDLPETGFGVFSAQSNVFLSSKQLRMSDADVKLSDLHLTGGLVGYFDSNPRLEADVKLKNINFDYFRDVWREKQKNSGQGDFFLKFDKSMNFNWLRNLQTTIDFKINVEHFTFLERKGENASFRLYAKDGELGIYDVNFIYPSDILKGSFKLSVTNEQPLMNLTLTANELNTAYFDPEIPAEHPDAALRIMDNDSDSNTGSEPPTDAQANDSKKDDASSAKQPADGTIDKKPEESAKTDAAKDSTASDVGKANAKSADTKSKEPVKSDSSKVSTASDVNKVDLKDDKLKKPATDNGKNDSKKFEITPQSDTFTLAQAEIPGGSEDVEPVPPKPASGLEDLLPRKNKSKKEKGDKQELSDQKRWSEDLIDMSWMNGLSGVIDLNIGKLTHKNIVLGNLKLQATFGNDLMTFKALSFSYWGGQCSILGSMYGGKVPGFSISLSFVDGRLQDLIKSFFDRENIFGGVSISATLNTSGINFLSWVSQAEGKMVMVGRGVTIQGFNLQGVVDAVTASRTSSDVVSGVNLTLNSGQTTFSIDGNINIKNGMLRTPGMNIRSDTVLGNLMGEVKLIPWTLDLSALFQFPSLSSETVPTMTVQLIGPIPQPEMSTDTSSLEAFVAKRIISK